MKKVLCLILSIVVLVGSASSAYAGIPYEGDWGFLYREPEYQNGFGRMWYQVLGSGLHANCVLESYYTYGAAVDITFTNIKYVNGRQENYNKKYSDSKTSGSSAFLNTVTNPYHNVYGYFYTGTEFYGGAYRFSHTDIK